MILEKIAAIFKIPELKRRITFTVLMLLVYRMDMSPTEVLRSSTSVAAELMGIAGEDADVERRFRLLGLHPRNVKYRALCYHQYHPALSRDDSIARARDLDREQDQG